MPNVILDVYLFFTENCQEAMEFYKSIFGGELKVQTMDTAAVCNASAMPCQRI